MLRRYETLLLTVPEITQDETKTLEKEVDRLIKQAKGNTVSFERWGKYRLSYPVKKNDYGVYFLVRFEAPQGSELLEELKSFFAIKVNNFVMRTMTSSLDMDETLAYQRPKSLEETPGTRGDVKAFLKEHKMEGLLSSVESKDKSAAKEEATEEQASEQAEAEA